MFGGCQCVKSKDHLTPCLVKGWASSSLLLSSPVFLAPNQLSPGEMEVDTFPTKNRLVSCYQLKGVLYIYMVSVPAHFPVWIWKVSQRDSCQRSSFSLALFLESIHCKILFSFGEKKRTWVKHPNKVALLRFLSCPFTQLFYCDTPLENKWIKCSGWQSIE